MNTNKSTLTILFASLCAVAVFSGLWGFLSGDGSVPALVAAVILLVAAQLVMFAIMSDKEADNSHPETLETIDARLGNLEQQITRLTRLRLVPEQPEPVKQLASTKPELPQQPIELPAPPIQSYSGPNYLDDRRLSLYLEPVVEISSMTTKFYRAEMTFESERSGRIRITDAADEIAASGHGADVDMKFFNQLVPVIDRLVQKGRIAGIICPMSRHSFSNQFFLEKLTRYLQQHRQLARVLVIEISQKNLADLSQDGMAGLAFLAQIGATFCLGGAGLESPDLDSLASLGFRYLDLDYNENIERYSLQAFSTIGPAAKLRARAQKVDIQLIGSGLVRKSQRDAINHVITFGRGSMFSMPRLVRTDFANQSVRYEAA